MFEIRVTRIFIPITGTLSASGGSDFLINRQSYADDRQASASSGPAIRPS